MTRADVLEGNEDLITAAVALLSHKKSHTLDFVMQKNSHDLPVIKLKTRNIDRLDITLGNNQIRSRYPQHGTCFIELHDELGDTAINQLDVVVKGYKDEQLVVRRCEQLMLDATKKSPLRRRHESIIQ